MGGVSADLVRRRSRARSTGTRGAPAANTRRAYLGHWEAFQAWAERRGYTPAPAAPETVAAQDDGSGRLTVRRSKTDQDGAGAVLYIGRQAMAGRWSSSVMPASYIRGQSAGRNAVAQYYADQQE